MLGKAGIAGRRMAVAGVVVLAGSVCGQDSTQYWHERYHGILSMAAYGDYQTLCPQQTFTQANLLKSYPTSTEAPWTLLSQWGPTASGISGFNVIIPEMDKVVMVFQGVYGWENVNMSVASLDPLGIGSGCVGCTANAGALQAYLEAKEATNDWEVVKTAVNATAHQWSITGHGFGGMVAQIAALDLGWRGLSHWSHNHGSPRVFNPAAASLYNKMYAGEAGQRCVANEDSWPEIIPASADYQHTLTGFHIYGTNSTYGMNYDTCVTDPQDPNCLGGTVESDHYFYYTAYGSCGGDLTYSTNETEGAAASLSAEYVATALSIFNTSAYYATATTSSALSSSTLLSTSAPLASRSAAPSASVTPAASAAPLVRWSLVSTALAGLVAVFSQLA